MNYYRTSDGTTVDQATAIDDLGVVKDGFTVRARVSLMDSAMPPSPMLIRDGHRPGTVAVTDADLIAREAKRNERKARLGDAWRHPGPNPTKAPVPTTDGSPYERRDRRLEQAWRGGLA